MVQGQSASLPSGSRVMSNHIDVLRSSSEDTLARITELARRIRIHCVRMTYRARASHVASALSIADILAVLYGGVLRIDPRNPAWVDRDRLVLSKGHAAVALYSVLAEVGFFPVNWLDSYGRDGSPLVGHVTSHGVPGVEVSTGSLGHGLPIAAGMALAGKMDRRNYRVYAILSDGECDEGSTWEAALFAAHHKLDALTAVIDANGWQGFGRTEEVLTLSPLRDKWESFGWTVVETDGHDVAALLHVLTSVPVEMHRPTCIIARTVKGKGVSFMEDRLEWHYKSPTEHEFRQALGELGQDQ